MQGSSHFPSARVQSGWCLVPNPEFYPQEPAMEPQDTFSRDLREPRYIDLPPVTPTPPSSGSSVPLSPLQVPIIQVSSHQPDLDYPSERVFQWLHHRDEKESNIGSWLGADSIYDEHPYERSPPRALGSPMTCSSESSSSPSILGLDTTGYPLGMHSTASPFQDVEYLSVDVPHIFTLEDATYALVQLRATLENAVPGALAMDVGTHPSFRLWVEKYRGLISSALRPDHTFTSGAAFLNRMIGQPGHRLSLSFGGLNMMVDRLAELADVDVGKVMNYTC